MSLASATGFAILLGRLILTHFERDLRVNEIGLLALSYVLGIGVYTWGVYVFVLLGGKATLLTTLSLASSMLMLAYLLRCKHSHRRIWSFRFSYTVVADWVMLALLAPFFGLSVLVAFRTPIYWPDSVYYFDGLGRVLAVEGTIYGPALKAWVFVHGLHSPLLQMLHGTTYLISVDDVSVFYAGFYISLVLIFAFVRWDTGDGGRPGGAYRMVRSVSWRVLTLCFASIPFVFAMGYVVLSSLPAAVYFTGGVLIWKRFLDRPSRSVAVLAGTLFALATWTRSEAILFYLPTTVIALVMAIVRPPIRRHIVPLVLPPFVMDLSRYAFVILSGQLAQLPPVGPIPHADLLLQLGFIGFALLISRGGENLRDWLSWGVLLGLVAGILATGAVLVFHWDGIASSSIQLWRLVADLVWGLTGLAVVAALFSPSLFNGSARMLFLVIIAVVLLRILLYAGIYEANQSDATITHSGNRVLLYIWPLVLYWVSSSRELRLVLPMGRGKRAPIDSQPLVEAPPGQLD